MKIERLTENKIRVLVNSSDFDIENIDINRFLSQTLEDNLLLTDILKKANDEIGFNTDGCKLLIESFFSYENLLVFTITKYIPKAKKKVSARKKSSHSLDYNNVFRFDSFEDFCLFCERANDCISGNLKKSLKNVSLFLYNNTYYLMFKNINFTHMKHIYYLLTEFATPMPCESTFECKLLEHGKLIIKNNAILTGIRYFASSD